MEEPKTLSGWFVKDFADGWIFFENENEARTEAKATGAIMHRGFLEEGDPRWKEIRGKTNGNQ